MAFAPCATLWLRALPHRRCRRGTTGLSPVTSTGRGVLVTLLALNGAMFVVEVAAGRAGESMGLIADGLDMGADAGVYLLALLAIGAPAWRKVRAARFAGNVQLLLALIAIAEVARRWFAGGDPDTRVMAGVSALALGVNVACLALLRRHRHGEVHLQAAWIFSATDVQANLGVLLAAWLVDALRSQIPDLLIGLAVCGLVLRGAFRIRARAAQEAG